MVKDSDIAGLEKLVKTIHQNRSKVFAQINHAGARGKKEINWRIAKKCASAIEHPIC